MHEVFQHSINAVLLTCLPIVQLFEIARQVILLHCRFVFICIYIYIYYIYIYQSQSTHDSLIVQLLPVFHWHLRQLQAPLGGGGYMVPTSRPFLFYVILPTWPRPLPLLSRGGA